MQAYWPSFKRERLFGQCPPRRPSTGSQEAAPSPLLCERGQINNLCNLTLNLRTRRTRCSPSSQSGLTLGAGSTRRSLLRSPQTCLSRHLRSRVSLFADRTFCAFVDTPAAEPISLGPGVTEYIPNLVSARVSGDYASVVFQFAKPTDQAGMVPGSPCTDALTDATVALMGGDPVCLWQPATGQRGRIRVPTRLWSD